MKNNCFSKRVLPQAKIYSAHQAVSTEKVVVDGRVLSRAVIVTDDPAEPARDVKASDFYLENLLDAGTDLKHCTLSASAFTAVASMPILSDEKFPKSSQNVSETKES